MNLATVAFLFVCTAAGVHVDQNPLYHQLTSAGVIPDVESRLPSPLLSDDLEEQEQQAAFGELFPDGKREQFFRKSIVAPQATIINKISDVTHVDQPGTLRRVDFWYIAHGDFAAIGTEAFLESLGTGIGDDQEAHALDMDALAERGITIDEDHEHLGNAEFSLLKKVRMQSTGRSYWSQSDQSILVASQLDSRFLEDESVPNQWRALVRDDAGELIPGEPAAYDGAGGYIKLTRVLGSEDEIFVEGHFIFFEPEGWFGGANLLGAKLPALIQREVRQTRRAMIEASRDAAPPDDAAAESEP